MKSLVVDDDATCSAIFQAFLSKQGDCDAVLTGMDAIKAFTSSLNSGHPYDIILIDIMMPHMDGYEVLKTIRSIEADYKIAFPFNVKIILTTALDDYENRKIEQSLDPCSEAYIVKSAYPDDLYEKLALLGFELKTAY